MDQKIGSWAFIVGVILAVIMGLAIGAMDVTGATWVGYVPLLLVILGLVIGFLNIGDREVGPFLVAAIALMVTGIAGTGLLEINTVLPPLGTILQSMFHYVVILVAPAALIVALLDFYKLAGTPKGTAAK